MFCSKWFAPSLSLLLFIVLAAPAFAENDGQDDLDKATQLKVAAETLDDLAKVIDRLDTALEKGLDKENKEFAEELLVSTLVQRGTLFATAVFNIPENDPQGGMGIQFRSWALTDLGRAVEMDGRLWEAHLLIGRLQSRPHGDDRAARRALSQVIKAPDITPEQKAEALALRSAVQSDEKKQLEDLNSAVELLPKSSEYLRLRAAYLYGKEKLDDALADVDRALALEEDHAGTHRQRGMILLGLKRYDEALANFNRAGELEPDAALSYQQRGELYRQKGEPEKAVEQLTKALELAPDSVGTLLVRAAVLYQLKQTDRALEDIERAIGVAPQFVQPYLMRAEIYAATDRLNEAIAQLEQLLQQSPGNVPLLNRLGSFYLMAGRPRKAIETLTQVIQQEPENLSALRFRADSYLNIGQHAEAIADFDRAIALDGDDESILNNFAWVLATSPDDKLRNGKRAVVLATKASELTGHQTPHVLSTLGAAYAEMGDFESAKKWSQAAVELSKKAVESAENDEERAKLQTDLEQLQKELASYEEGKPVRERQTAEEATEKPAKTEDKPAADDTLTPATKPAAPESSVDS